MRQVKSNTGFRHWLSKRALLGAVGAAFAFSAMSNSAAAFPDRPVKIIVPFSAGGTTDTAARALAISLTKMWKQPVVVENKPGAGNVIALVAAKNAAPDGHTVIIAPDPSLSVNPLTYSKLPYNVQKDFQPITVLIKFPLGIVASKKSGITSVKELVEAAKKKELSYGSFGPGTAPHLLMSVFQPAAGIKIQHVPYKGVAPVKLALKSGEVQVSVMSIGAAGSLLKSGDARMIAVQDTHRPASAPEVPTLAEIGYPEMNRPAWWALLAPKGTPKAVVDQLQRDFQKAMHDEPFQKFVKIRFYTLGDETPEQTAKLIQDTTDYWRPVIKSIGLKLN